MFANMCSNLCDGAQVLVDIFANFQGVDGKVGRIKEIEHRGDDMTHEILTKLNQTFITPFDRGTFTGWRPPLTTCWTSSTPPANGCFSTRLRAPRPRPR